MIPRILEVEVMDTADEARDYDAMDHRAVNTRFADDFQRLAMAHSFPADGRILDIGTGTALIPIEMATRLPQLHFTAIDLAEEMLRLGRRNVERANLSDRITLQRIDAKDLAGSDAAFDAVVSNSIVHHIPEPLAVFREMRRVIKPGGLLFVRDLLRPESEVELTRLIDLYAAAANERQQSLFADSLHAALTLEEVADLLAAIGMPRDAVEQTSDRHWTVACRTECAIGERGSVLELEGDPIDDTDRSFWEEKSIDELAAEQSVPVIKKLEEVIGGWPEEERDDGFEDEFRRWRSGGAAENRM